MSSKASTSGKPIEKQDSPSVSTPKTKAKRRMTAGSGMAVGGSRAVGGRPKNSPKPRARRRMNHVLDSQAMKNSPRARNSKNPAASSISPRRSSLSSGQTLSTSLKEEYVILPDSFPRQLWTWVMVVVLIWYCVSVPMRYVFLRGEDLDLVSNWSLLAIDTLMDVLSIADIVLRLRFFAFFKENILVDSPKEISLHYLQTWFTIDLITTIPLQTISRLIFGFHTFNVFYVLKYLRILRAKSYIVDVDAFLTYKKIFIAAAVSRLVKIFMSIMLFLCFVSCLFFGISNGDTSDSTWRNTYIVSDFWGDKIMQSLYFVTQTLFTVGYGDFSPITNTEMIASCFIMVSGSMTIALVIANMTSLFVNMDATLTLHRKRMEEIEVYMQYRDLPTSLRDSVRRFYEALWQSSKGRIEDDILSEIPYDMMKHVTALSRNFVEEIRFFKYLDPDFLMALKMKFTFSSHLAGDIILRKNMPVAELWMVNAGEIHILGTDNRTVVDKIREGAAFGAHSLFGLDFDCPNAARAGTYLELYVLSRLDIDEVLRQRKFHKIKYLLTTDLDRENNEDYLNILKKYEKLKKKWKSSEASLKRSVKLSIFLDDTELFKPLWWYIQPHGKLKLTWDSIKMTVIIYFSVMVFLRLAFAANSNAFKFTIWIDLILELYFIADATIISALADILKKDDTQAEHSARSPLSMQKPLPKRLNQAMKDYFEKYGSTWLYGSEIFFFLMTIASVVAWFDVFGSQTIYAYLALPNAFRALKFIGEVTNIRYHLEFHEYRVSNSILMATKLFFVTLLSFHWISCIWILVQQADSSYFTEAVPSGERYLESFYFTLSTMATVGYGEIRIDGFNEWLFTTLVMTIGVALYSGVISFITSILHSGVVTEHNLEHQEICVEAYMKDREISGELQSKVQKYFKYKWNTTGNVNEKLMLSMFRDNSIYKCNTYLPSGLKREIVYHVTNPILQSSRLLKKAPHEFIRILSRELKHEIYCEDHMILTPSLHRLILIEKGRANIVSDDTMEIMKSLNEGDAFGEVALLDRTRSGGTVQAADHCEVWYLENLRFQYICNVYPNYISFIQDDIDILLNEEVGVENIQLNLKNRKLSKMRDAGDVEGTAGNATGKKRVSKNGKPFIAWNLFTFLLLCYIVSIYPFRIAFNDGVPVDFTFVMDYLCDIAFVADIILRYKYFEYEDASGIIVNEEDIKEAYKKRWAVWDIASVLPLDVLIAPILHLTGLVNVDIAVLQLLRTNRLIRVCRMSLHLSIINNQVNSKRQNIFRVIKLLFTLFLASHWSGSIFYLIPKITGTGGNEDWTTSPAWSSVGSNITIIEAYVVSLYWAVATLTGIGYGDLFPVSNIERLYTIFILLLGGFIYSLIVANLDEIVAQADITSVLFQTKMVKLKRYLGWRKIDADLQYRIDAHMLELWLHQKGGEENTILSFLPTTLRRDVISELCDGCFRKIPVIKKWKSFDEIYDCLIARTYTREELIYEKGELANECYIVSRGQVDAISDDENNTVYATFTTGTTFGESSFLLKALYDCTTHAVTLTHCFVLKLDDFERILVENPNLREKFQYDLAQAKEDIQSKSCVTKFKRNMSSRKMSKFMLEEVDISGLLKTFVVMPNVLWRQIWVVFHVIVIIYNAIVIPYRLAILQNQFHFQSSESNWLFVCDVVGDLICYIDIILSMTIFAQFYHGVLVKKYIDIFKSYLKNGFLFDIICVLPIDYFYLTLSGTPLTLAATGIFRLNRLLRLGKMTEYATVIKSALEQRRVYIKSSYRQLMKLWFLILLSAHFIACCRALILLAQDALVGSASSDLYVESLYWSLYTITTVGYGNVKVISIYDKLFSILVMFVGAFLCDAGITATLSNLIDAIDGEDANVKRSKDCAFTFLNQWNLTPKLESQLHTYFEYSANVQKNIDESSMLRIIPPHFTPEIVNQMALKNLDYTAIPLLKTFNSGMMKSLLRMMKPQLYLPQTVILKSKMIPKKLTLLVKGYVEILTPEEEALKDTEAKDNALRRISLTGSGSLSQVKGRIITAGVVGGGKYGTKCKYSYSSISVVETFELSMLDYSILLSRSSAVGGLYNTFSDLLLDPIGVKCLLKYVESRYSSENLKFYLEVGEYKELQDGSDRMIARAKTIYENYLADDAAFQININSTNRKAIDEIVEFGSITCFDDARQEIFLLMQKDTLPRFIQSSYFHELIEVRGRRRRSSNKPIDVPEAAAKLQGTAKRFSLSKRKLSGRSLGSGKK